MKPFIALILFLIIFGGMAVGPWLLLGPQGFWQNLVCGIVCGVTGTIGLIIGVIVAVAIADDDD